MNAEIRLLVAEIEELKKQAELLRQKQDRLDGLQKQCKHKWGSPQRKFKNIPGYTIPGDPPGTMGVDWRGPTYVSGRCDVWYERECSECGLVQRTTQTRPIGSEPVFS